MKRSKSKSRILILFRGAFTLVSIVYIYFGGSFSSRQVPDLEDPVVETSLENIMGDPKSLIQKAISENPVFVFSKSYCPYCKYAPIL